MTGAAPILHKIADLQPYLISAADTVKLMPLAVPDDGTSTSVFWEIWEPGGAQPVNSHEDSAEIFIVLSGEAVAHSDDQELTLGAGDVLILQPGSEHRIINTSATEKLHTITIMANDGGFAKLVTDGVPTALTEDEQALPR